MLGPEGIVGCFLGTILVSEQVLRTGLLAGRTPQIAWLRGSLVERVYWAVGYAV